MRVYIGTYTNNTQTHISVRNVLKRTGFNTWMEQVLYIIHKETTYICLHFDKPSAECNLPNLQHHVHVTEQSAVFPAKHEHGGDALNSKTLGIKVGKCLNRQLVNNLGWKKSKRLCSAVLVSFSFTASLGGEYIFPQSFDLRG